MREKRNGFGRPLQAGAHPHQLAPPFHFGQPQRALGDRRQRVERGCSRQERGKRPQLLELIENRAFQPFMGAIPRRNFFVATRRREEGLVGQRRLHFGEPARDLVQRVDRGFARPQLESKPRVRNLPRERVRGFERLGDPLKRPGDKTKLRGRAVTRAARFRECGEAREIRLDIGFREKGGVRPPKLCQASRVGRVARVGLPRFRRSLACSCLPVIHQQARGREFGGALGFARKQVDLVPVHGLLRIKWRQYQHARKKPVELVPHRREGLEHAQIDDIRLDLEHHQRRRRGEKFSSTQNDFELGAFHVQLDEVNATPAMLRGGPVERSAGNRDAVPARRSIQFDGVHFRLCIHDEGDIARTVGKRFTHDNDLIEMIQFARALKEIRGVRRGLERPYPPARPYRL